MNSYGMFLSAAGMKVNDHQQTLIANNMANAHTPGFKHDLAVVMQRRVASATQPGGFEFSHPVLDGLPGGVHVRPTFQVFAQGSLERTNRPLDAAVLGDGFFAVSDGTTTRYTRDGRFAINEAGDLMMAAGNGRWHVLDDAGAPIRTVPGGGKASIDSDGQLRQGEQVIARLGLHTTEDMQTLRKVGENLFEAGADMHEAQNARIEPGTIEASTFDALRGLAAMIETTRAFEINASLIQMQDQLTGQAISTVGRVA